MEQDQTLQTLRMEVERIQRSLERITAMPEMNLSDLYVAKKCAAQFLGVCYRTIERWRTQGYIECIRIGGRVYFLKAELLRVARLYSSGIAALSGESRPQTLPDIHSRHGNRPEAR